MKDIAIVWDLNGVLFKRYILDFNTLEIVKDLNKRGFCQYVCTNTLGWRLKQYKEKYALEKYFKRIYSTQEMGLNKTNPRVFLTLKKEIEKEILFIDDKRKNVRVAESVGIESILYSNDFELKENFKLLNIYDDFKGTSSKTLR